MNMLEKDIQSLLHACGSSDGETEDSGNKEDETQGSQGEEDDEEIEDKSVGSIFRKFMHRIALLSDGCIHPKRSCALSSCPL